MLKKVTKGKDEKSKFSRFLSDSSVTNRFDQQSKSNLLDTQDYKATKFKTHNRKILESVNTRFTNKTDFCLTDEDQFKRNSILQSQQHKFEERNLNSKKSNRFNSVSLVDSLLLDTKSSRNTSVIKVREPSYERSRDFHKNRPNPRMNTK